MIVYNLSDLSLLGWGTLQILPSFNFFSLLKKCEVLTWETGNDTVFNSFKLSFQAAVTEVECGSSVCLLNSTLILRLLTMTDHPASSAVLSHETS